jgi:mRNA-degrading endonuclease RelE of RelBE toxin-antitoxin system
LPYTILYNPDVFDQMDSIPATYKRRIVALINTLEHDPRPAQSKQLHEPLEHLRRVRLEKWRIVYAVDDDAEEVLIVRVGNKVSTGTEFYDDLETE